MRGLSRYHWLSAGALVYTCFEAAEHGGGRVAWLAIVLLPLILHKLWRDTARRSELDPASLKTRRGVRLVGFGALLWLAAHTGPPAQTVLRIASAIGAATACSAALALLRKQRLRASTSQSAGFEFSVSTPALALGFWGAATALGFLESAGVLAGRFSEYAVSSAAVAALLLLAAEGLWLLEAGRLELGAADRALGTLTFSVLGLVMAGAARALGVTGTEQATAGALVSASLFAAWSGTARDPVRVARTQRRVLGAVILALPVGLGAATAARLFPGLAAPLLFGAGAWCAFAGLYAGRIAERLNPERSRFLYALGVAADRALQPDTELALRETLLALGKELKHAAARPLLWHKERGESSQVDVAGYLHTAPASVPEIVYELARTEAEYSLRLDVLRALQVRRPETRPALVWFEAQGVFVAALLGDPNEVLGLLTLPQAERKAPLTLEEARALRALAERLAAALTLTSALARSLERERLALAAQQRAENEQQRLAQELRTSSLRRRALPELFAAKLQSHCFSYAARSTLDRLAEYAARKRPALLIIPAGVDALPYAAYAHLRGAFAEGPLVVVDALRSEEHALPHWQHPEDSPLALARAGTLFIADLPALPVPVQEYIARACAERAHDAAGILFLASSRPRFAELDARGKLAGTWLELALVEVVVPSLAERGEDLRALCLDMAARLGIARNGSPLVLDPGAQRWLLECEFSVNELELAVLLERAAAHGIAPSLSVEALRMAAFGELGVRLDAGRKAGRTPV